MEPTCKHSSTTIGSLNKYTNITITFKNSSLFEEVSLFLSILNLNKLNYMLLKELKYLLRY